MFILWWIIFGALVGWLATIIAGENARYGAVGNILIGIVGAAIGSLLARVLGFGGVTGFNVGSILVALVGAVLLVMAMGSLRTKRY